MLWQVYIFPQTGQPDLEARRVAHEIADLNVPATDHARSARGFLLDGQVDHSDIEQITRQLLVDPVIESYIIADAAGQPLSSSHGPWDGLLQAESSATVLLKPGVMDPVAQSVQQAIRQLGVAIEQVRTFRRYWLPNVQTNALRQLVAARVLANDAIEQVHWGSLQLTHLSQGSTYEFELIRVAIRGMTDSELERVSRQGQLSLNLVEMQTIQQHFRSLGRDPTDAELETLAQTWSEHCSHKTLRGRIDYEELDSDGRVTRREQFGNLLKQTIFQATCEIRTAWGPERDWCVSVFEDNAGIVRFNDTHHVCFKVETHNHPSAIEPYGGANTGLGGVLRDSMGTGLGARPIANTDVFCFAPPDLPADHVPPGVLHPKRVMKGVVAGVRDYGNRMGIPTVNGAVYFDERYLGNPLVFCGNVGLIPANRTAKQARAGDLIVAVGGRTGRDGIHGATFSSIELTHESEELSGGAVQIGNAITQKMMLDVLLEARDRGLYHAITDCGAGGFSSAVGEMAATIGAEVLLDRVPLKYQGLSYCEIWISEAQERMVLAVPPDQWPEFEQLCRREDVEATVIGSLVPSGRLVLKYEDQIVADLDMHFLHDGRPPVVRKAQWRPSSGASTRQGRSPSAAGQPPRPHAGRGQPQAPFNDTLRRILASWNVCSKEWIIRQYDHEVQGGSVIKPLVGANNDGPSDAAVIRPSLGSNQGVAIACGMNPLYGDIDPYWMAASAIDEAVRNCVAVGADPSRIAILDNFCWGNTDRPDELGKLVRAAIACRDVAPAYGTPFISGKDSLNNEFKMPDGWRSGTHDGRITIPPTLLISALGQVHDVRRCVTMDLKEPENILCAVGLTGDELGGSHYSLVTGHAGSRVPHLEDLAMRRQIFNNLHAAIELGLVRACHDLSEGGLAAAAAEMCLAGQLGAELFCNELPADPSLQTLSGDRRVATALFSESNTRFLVEVRPENLQPVLNLFAESATANAAVIGRVTATSELVIRQSRQGAECVRVAVDELRECWQAPLRW